MVIDGDRERNLIALRGNKFVIGKFLYEISRDDKLSHHICVAGGDKQWVNAPIGDS